MQNSYRLAADLAHAQMGAAQSKYAFPELKFMRLIVWKDRQVQIKPGTANLAGQLLQSFSLPFMPGVFMDFCGRGAKLPAASARVLAKIVSHCHVVDDTELSVLANILSDHWADTFDRDNEIDHVQVGDLDGKSVLAIQWTDTYKEMKRISVYMTNGQDGSDLQVIHFSAPVQSFDLAKKYFSEVLRSIQWQECCYRSA